MGRSFRSAHLRAGRRLGALILLAGLSLTPPTHAQGCSQCRDAVGQTPAQTQSAYRRAITLMVIAGTSVFAAGIITFKRFR